VLAGAALVGVVVQATRDRSEVMLEADPAFRLRVTAPRAAVEGILYGNGGPTLAFLPDCSGEDDPALALQPGDVLTASRASSLCALPAIVGTVKEVTRPKGESFARAIVEPATQASRLDGVVVLQRDADAEVASGAGAK
jgi:cell shape-determining protein MreC